MMSAAHQLAEEDVWETEDLPEADQHGAREERFESTDIDSKANDLDKARERFRVRTAHVLH